MQPPSRPEQGDAPQLDAAIVGVTVYPDQARVTRRGHVELPPGRHRLYVEPLPLAVRPDSLRVSGRGAAVVLGVDLVHRSHDRAPDQHVDELRERRQRHADELAELTDAEAAQRGQLAFLDRLGLRSSASYAGAIASGTADADAAVALAATLAARSAEVHAQLRRLAGRKREVNDAIEALDRTLQQLKGAVLPDRLAAVIDLEVTSAVDIGGTGGELSGGLGDSPGGDPGGDPGGRPGDGAAEERDPAERDRAGHGPVIPVWLELSYLVSGAEWATSYDLRVSGERLLLTWYAQVTQQTGEHWPECDLALSTARPSTTAAVPDLPPWYLRTFQPPVYAARGGSAVSRMARSAAPAPGAPQESVDDMSVGSAPAMAAAPPITDQVATVEQAVTTATYRSIRPVAVPSDGAAHRATVAVLDLTADLDYVTAPVQSATAQLRATVVNTSEHTLLPGPAAVFSGNDFVATTHLDTWAPGEQVELALGVDDRIRVERKLADRRAAKARIGSTRHREVEYRTTVCNHTAQPVRISVLDQLPVSLEHTIVVRELLVSPKPTDRTELGVLTWTFAVAPGQTVEVAMRLRVEAPDGVELSGWRE